MFFNCRRKVFNAFVMGKRSYTAQQIFNCPRKEFSKYINNYRLAADNGNYGSVFVIKDKIWSLYSEIKDNYEFGEIELQTLLNLLPYSSVEEDLKVQRVQEIIDKMIEMGYNPGGDGLCALIIAHSSSSNAMDKIESLLYSWKHSPPQTKRIYNILFRIYARIHGTEIAEQWFDSLIGTMIYTEIGVKAQTLRPLIKDGGVYTQLIRSYCDEGNLPMAIKKFNEMFRKFDQSNRNGSLGRIIILLIKDSKFYEALAWYTSGNMYHMYFDETGYHKVFRGILFYAFSKNVFISAKDIIKILGELGPEWKLEENELSGENKDDSAIETLISDLNVDKVVEHQAKTSSLYYSQDNCLDTEQTIESALDFEGSDELGSTKDTLPNFVKEMRDLFTNEKFGNQNMIDTDLMPPEYDKRFMKKDPHAMLGSVLSEMFKKGISPSLLTFTSFIFAYYKVGAYNECVTIFEYMKKRLALYYDAHTIGIMTKVYTRLGQNEKSDALSRLNVSEIMEGDLTAVGTQFDLMLSAGRLEELEDTFKEMDDHRDLGSRNMTYALRMYIKENKMDDAKRLFERIISTQREEGKMCGIPFNVMIQKYSQMGDMFSFNGVITQMSNMGLEMDEDTYVTIIRSYVNWNDPETALEYYRKMVSQGLGQTLFSYHVIIDLFARMNNENGIIDVIRAMIVKGVVPNELTLSLLVGFFVNLGKIEEAHQVQDLFQRSFPHISSSMRCHNIFINHYTKLENRAGVLKELHRATAVYKAIPDIHTYTAMVKVFALTDIKAARKIFDLALEKCSHGLNVEIFANMMEASYNAEDYESAREIYTRMNALDVVPDQRILKVLSRLPATGASAAG